MKKCYFIGVPLRREAIGRHFLALGNEMLHRGHQVVMIAPPGERDLAPVSTAFQSYAWPSSRPTRLLDAWFLWRLISRHRPDCLIAHFAPVNWMCLVGWLRHVRCRVAWYHTLSTQIDLDTKRSRASLRWLRLRKRLVYGKATHLVAISRAALEDAQSVFGVPREKCRIWNNSLADPAEWLQLQEAARREDLIVCAGCFDRTKGQDVFAEALGRCAAKLNETRIEFLGIGPQQSAVHQQLERFNLNGRCMFRGQVSHDEVVRRMSVARLTVVPSRSEAFGLVNIESMSVGTPVVASDIDGIQEVVRDGTDGFLVPAENPDALADRLIRVLQDSALREQLGRNARQRFVDIYEQSKVVTAQADWLENITGASTQPTGKAQMTDERYPLKV